jgi:hypothetical protein
VLLLFVLLVPLHSLLFHLQLLSDSVDPFFQLHLLLESLLLALPFDFILKVVEFVFYYDFFTLRLQLASVFFIFLFILFKGLSSKEPLAFFFDELGDGSSLFLLLDYPLLLPSHDFSPSVYFCELAICSAVFGISLRVVVLSHGRNYSCSVDSSATFIFLSPFSFWTLWNLKNQLETVI